MERRVTKIEDQNISVLFERMGNLTAEVHEQGRTLTWILRTLLGLAVTVIGGALIYAITAGGV